MPAATEQDEKVRENRLRRMAERQGLKLSKSPRRDPRALDYNRWMVVADGAEGHPLIGAQGGHTYYFTLDEIEAHLTGAGEQ